MAATAANRAAQHTINGPGPRAVVAVASLSSSLPADLTVVYFGFHKQSAASWLPVAIWADDRYLPAMMMSRLILVSVVCATASCATSGNYTRSIHGTVGGYSLRNVQAKPINVMVARKIQDPLYIVLDANRVKDTWDMKTSACVTKSRGCEQFKLMHVQEFVRRDLKNAMQHYFASVKVVTSLQEVGAGPSVIAEVKVDEVRLHTLARGFLTYRLIQMKWGFAFRRSDADDYTYSFAGLASSNDSYPTFEAGCAQLIENAISSMLTKWMEGGGIKALRRKTPAEPPPPAPTKA